MFSTSQDTDPYLASIPSSPALSRRGPRPELAWRALEEVDFGLVLLDPEGRVHHANHLARHELGRERYLKLENGVVTGCEPSQAQLLTTGLRQAGIGRRQLITLSRGDDSLPVVCVPLSLPYEDGGEPPMVLLMLGRQLGSQTLAVTFFARMHGLTPAEENVLRGLCAGLAVPDIAQGNGVAESTIRTQIRTLRDKTGAGSIRQLVQRIAALPPVVPVSLKAASPPAAQCWG